MAVGLEQHLLLQLAQVQLELAIFLQFDQEFINHERVGGDLLGLLVTHEFWVFVPEGQQTTWLAANYRDSLLSVGV